MHFQLQYHSYTEIYPTKLLALYHALRNAVVDQIVPAGTRLPSSRALAEMYGISRGTVNQVYDMLASEGYLECQTGRGTFVSYQAPQNKAAELKREASYTLSDWGEGLFGLPNPLLETAEEAKRWTVDFRVLASSNLEWFPAEEWHRCLHAQARILCGSDRSKHVPVSALGDEGLRSCIAQYLRRMRGIAVPPEQVAIFNGSMQAIALSVQLLINGGDRVIVENPGYRGISKAVQSVGGHCIPGDVDAQGIIPAEWNARLLFVTPNRQFPTGAVLPMDRRQQLLRWAYENDAVLIEDDYDSEFRHRGKSLEPLKVLDREERVIYIGSFSKTLPPHVRIGYAVLPSALAGPFAAAKALYEPQPANLLEQRTMAAWMQSGRYERHLRRMKRIYGRKFYKLQELLKTYLGGLFDWVEGDAGLHIFGWWRGEAEMYRSWCKACADRGVRWSEVSVPGHALQAAVRHGAYFHFPYLAEEEMQLGVAWMRDEAERLGLLTVREN